VIGVALAMKRLMGPAASSTSCTVNNTVIAVGKSRVLHICLDYC